MRTFLSIWLEESYEPIAFESTQRLAKKVSCYAFNIGTLNDGVELNGDLIDIIVAHVQPANGSLQFNHWAFVKQYDEDFERN